MIDIPLAPVVRLVGGARYETTDLRVHSESYLANSVTSTNINDAHLVQSDLLPAAGLIFAATAKMNVRVNFSQTIARPSFRELAAYYSYDPIINDFIDGNPELKMTAIDNYDLRYEWFPNPGELFSVSLFYKDLKDAIERGNRKVEGDVITFNNYDATLYGVEFEARKGLGFLGDSFNLFSLGGNLSLVKSVVRLSDTDFNQRRQFLPNSSRTRPLYDQSPYVFNMDFNYSNPVIGTSATMIFNVSGPRIAITKLNTDDVYEQPTPTLDLIISQKLGRHLTLKFGAKNLLNPKIERTYGKNSDLLYSSYTKGRAFGLSMTYDF
jgi:TonB-dependent receptor